MLASSFSSVLLPEPLRPTIAEELALADLERDPVERAQLAVLAAGEGVHRPLFERVDPGSGSGRTCAGRDLDRQRARGGGATSAAATSGSFTVAICGTPSVIAGNRR